MLNQTIYKALFISYLAPSAGDCVVAPASSGFSLRGIFWGGKVHFAGGTGATALMYYTSMGILPPTRNSEEPFLPIHPSPFIKTPSRNIFHRLWKPGQGVKRMETGCRAKKWGYSSVRGASGEPRQEE